MKTRRRRKQTDPFERWLNDILSQFFFSKKGKSVLLVGWGKVLSQTQNPKCESARDRSIDISISCNNMGKSKEKAD